ncbi:hypothetical protein QQ045_017670 [Rhodiola kirilowii]
MVALPDIGVSAIINILTAFAFLLAFGLLRIQPINDKIYFPKWYITGDRTFEAEVIQGFLPDLVLKIFLFVLLRAIILMSKIERHITLSLTERRAAAKYYIMLLIVFIGSIVTGTTLEELNNFVHQPATE